MNKVAGFSGIRLQPKIRFRMPSPLGGCGSPLAICSSIQACICFTSAIIFVSVSRSVIRSALLPPKPVSVGMLLIPYSTPKSLVLPLLVSGESSSSSANANEANLSDGDAWRLSTRSVRRGVMVLHGVQADVVKRRSSSAFCAEQRRR